MILISVISYLIGSFPTAYLVVKGFAGKDIKRIGSGNVGAMNTVRALKEKSTKLAVIGFLIVLLGDMAKGALVIFLAQKLLVGAALQLQNLSFILAAFFVVLGHNYSVFLKFSGGRGAASLIGILFYLDIQALIIWGLPSLLFPVFFQIVLEKIGFEKKINWRKISDIISIIGKQMAGRMAGLVLGPLFLYFYSPEFFSPLAAGTILLLIKNIPRFKGYFEKSGENYGD